MSSPHDIVDWELFDTVVRQAREAGVSEATIQAEVAAELGTGEDWVTPFSLKGRLARFTGTGHRPRPPTDESPVMPPPRDPNPW
jgi:hypothetical protein